MRALFHGDKVLARASDSDHRGKREGQVVEILERSTTKIAGRLVVEDNLARVMPDDKRLKSDLIIPASELNGATHGQNCRGGHYAISNGTIAGCWKSQ